MTQTLTVHASPDKMEALMAFLKALKIPFETENAGQKGVIKDPELLRRIEDYENGKASLKTVSLEELQKMTRA